jgi:hypothetical protein
MEPSSEMLDRSTRRRLNRASARRDRDNEHERATGAVPSAPALPNAARSLRAIAGLMAALLVAAVVSVALSYLRQRQIAVLGDRLDGFAKALTERDDDLKKAAVTSERALALANRQAAALENANKIAGDALALGRRAWVGVSNAHIDGRLAANADLAIAIDYRNTGREPAADLAMIATPFVIETEKRAEPQTMSRLEQFADRCLAENYVGGGVAFPGSEGQTYQADAIVKASDVDDALVDGSKLVIVQSCIVYRSGGAIHHSAACHFFQSGKTPPDRFSLCAKGVAAD